MFDQTDITVSLFILFLICLSAFFSGSETALTAVSKARIHDLAKKGSKQAKLVKKLHERKEDLISAILLGNNLVNILASALATSLLIKYLGDTGIALATIIMTFLILVFAEVLPKTYAMYNATKLSRRVARPVSVIVYLLKPFTKCLSFIIQNLLKLFNRNYSYSEFLDHEEELRGVIDMHQGDTEEIKQERKMLKSILDLDDVFVSEIMSHRNSLTMMDVNAPIEKNVNLILKSPYTRLPVWEKHEENIIGVSHAKDLLREIRKHEGSIEKIDFRKTILKPWFIPENTNLHDQLQAFKKRKEHFAIVVDEYGDLSGIVTLEDILEEIVGDISDEHDLATKGILPQKDGSYIIDGSVTIRDLNRDLEWQLPDNDASTIAGLIIFESQEIPTVNKTFIYHNTTFKILARTKNQITKIQCKKQTRM